MTRRWLLDSRRMSAALCVIAGAASAQDQIVYKCPGNLYTGTLTSKEAAAKGCTALEGGAVTIIQGPQRRAPQAATASPAAGDSGAARSADQRVDPADQRARDTDKRRILDAELRREQERLNALRQEWNNGEPERRGDEKNYQKYLDRKAELKAGIDRSESDVAALKRELAKLPPAN